MSLPLCPALLDISHAPILLVIGLAIFLGTVGARVFQWLRIPKVVGYIAIGLLVGRTGLNLVHEDMIQRLLPFNFFALGVIGFMIGGELHREVFRRHGRRFMIILLAEGMATFLVVSLAVSLLAMIWLPPAHAIALGLMLGAIASATAPAATVDVLWEYKTRGVLTTTVFAIVAMDDGLALVLFALASSVTGLLIGSAGGGIGTMLWSTFYELAGAVALGVATGFGLNTILRRWRERERALTLVIGALALVIGVGLWIGVDVILAAMLLGATLTNLAPRRSHVAFEIVEGFAPPIYVLFFVIVGARLHVTDMAAWMWALAGAFVVGRTGGKLLGAYLGARWGRAADSVRRYLGLCLFSQAGVAIGLAILAAGRFQGESAAIGNAVATIVTATTFLVQLIGPPCVKLAVKKAGEVGLNVTEEDLVHEYKVADMVDREAPRFPEATRLANILKTIAETDALSYPVVDSDGRLVGLITIAHLKQIFASEGLHQWLLAHDLMEPPPDVASENASLAEAVSRMESEGLDCVPVVAAGEDPVCLGVLELRSVHRRLSQEVLRRQELAEA